MPKGRLFQFLLIVLVVLLPLSALQVSQSENGATENSWVSKTPMQEVRPSLGVAVVNGKIYAIADDVNYEYNPATDTWTAKKPMPTARRSFGIAVHQNKIYVIGGRIGFDMAKGEAILCSFNEVYDPLTDTWETKEPMPTNRSQLNANVVNGKIYLIGGRTGGQYSTVSLNEVYDPATNSWTTKTPIPTAVVQYASAVIDNRIYVIGGQAEFHDPMNIGFNQIYDPETDTWSQGASLPTVVWQAAAGATTGIIAPKRIYVIGGMPDGSIAGTNLNQVYAPENDTWMFGASMLTARYNLAVAVVNDVLYAIGGSPGFMLPFNAINEQYMPYGYGTVPPEISVVSPENKTYVSSNVSLTFTVNKQTSWLGYSLDGQETVTITGNTTIAGLTSGVHNIAVYAKDTFENTGNSETIVFSIEAPFPTTWLIAATLIVAVVGAGLLVYLKKRNKKTKTQRDSL